MHRAPMTSLPAFNRQSTILRLGAGAEPGPPIGIPAVLPGASTKANLVDDQQNLEAWLADPVGWGWQERKGLRNGSAADPGLQETLSKQADAKAVGQPPTSGGCRDNILPTNPQPATTAMRATDHRHQQTLSHGLIDRCLYGLARHFGGRPPQGLSGRGRPKLL
jgi:hypothetical protein